MDEFDGFLIKYYLEIGIVINIELDYFDYYFILVEVVEIFCIFEFYC